MQWVCWYVNTTYAEMESEEEPVPAGELLEGFLVEAHGVIAIEGHPDDGDGVQHVDYHGGHGQTEALHMESTRAPHCHRAHQCREHWHREEQGEDKGDDRIRIPVPVERVLVWIVQVDAVVIMRLVRLTVRLLTIRLALHARVPARICARTGLLAALSIRPARPAC